ncbi:MAG: inositol monophosphatase [Planctomycetes bacterium]|nr:inositol monophosphatase [Planctomycetota bacterium]
MSAELVWLSSLARRAGAVVLEHAGLVSVEKKGARDLVTAADRASEQLILAGIRERYPHDHILAEESCPETAVTGRVWIVDPLDGTTNFVHGIPHYAVSIALVDNGEPLLACVFSPKLGECFTAERGAGSFLEGQRLCVSDTSQLSEAVLCTGFHYRMEQKADSNLQHFCDFAPLTRGLRRLGSAALDLCYTAAGRYDGFWELHLAPWDVAAGALVASEAGAVVTDFRGAGQWLAGGQIVAANWTLNPAMCAVLQNADPRRLPGKNFLATP